MSRINKKEVTKVFQLQVALTEDVNVEDLKVYLHKAILYHQIGGLGKEAVINGKVLAADLTYKGNLHSTHLSKKKKHIDN